MQSTGGGTNRPHRQPPPRPRPPPPPLPARPQPQRSATLASHATPPTAPPTTTAKTASPSSSPLLARASTAWSSTLSPSSSPPATGGAAGSPRGRQLRAQASLSSAPLMATTLTGGKFRIPAEGSTTIAVGKDTYTIGEREQKGDSKYFPSTMVPCTSGLSRKIFPQWQ